VHEDGGKFTIKSASFDFKYTNHLPMSKDDQKAVAEHKLDPKKDADKIESNKRVCLMLICVKPTVSITITNGVSKPRSKARLMSPSGDKNPSDAAASLPRGCCFLVGRPHLTMPASGARRMYV